MKHIIFFITIGLLLATTGCRTGTIVFSGQLDQQAYRTAETLREVCKYPSYETKSEDIELYRTILAALIVNRSSVEQTEEYRARLINVLTATGISIPVSDRVTKVIVYGYVQDTENNEFSLYIKRLLFHLDNRQVLYDPYSKVGFTGPSTSNKKQP